MQAVMVMFQARTRNLTSPLDYSTPLGLDHYRATRIFPVFREPRATLRQGNEGKRRGARVKLNPKPVSNLGRPHPGPAGVDVEALEE